jgi:hypothetical protein
MMKNYLFTKFIDDNHGGVENPKNKKDLVKNCGNYWKRMAI